MRIHPGAACSFFLWYILAGVASKKEAIHVSLRQYQRKVTAKNDHPVSSTSPPSSSSRMTSPKPTTLYPIGTIPPTTLAPTTMMHWTKLGNVIDIDHNSSATTIALSSVNQILSDIFFVSVDERPLPLLCSLFPSIALSF